MNNRQRMWSGPRSNAIARHFALSSPFNAVRYYTKLLVAHTTCLEHIDIVEIYLRQRKQSSQLAISSTMVKLDNFDMPFKACPLIIVYNNQHILLACPYCDGNIRANDAAFLGGPNGIKAHVGAAHSGKPKFVFNVSDQPCLDRRRAC